MQKRNILLFAVLATMTMMFAGCSSAPAENKSVPDSNEKEVYEWRIYTLKESGVQTLDDFFQNTLIPAYNRQGI